MAVRLSVVLLISLLLSGCAAKKQISQPLPPEISQPPPPKPKVRPVKAGDYVLKGAEVLEGGTVVCHRPILLIDAKKKSEVGTVYLCR